MKRDGNGENLELRSQKSDKSDKAYKAEKAFKLSLELGETADGFESVLGEQWYNDAGKWINRIKSNHDKSRRVLSEVENAKKERRINTTPAQYAEQIWKEFQ